MSHKNDAEPKKKPDQQQQQQSKQQSSLTDVQNSSKMPSDLLIKSIGKKTDLQNAKSEAYVVLPGYHFKCRWHKNDKNCETNVFTRTKDVLVSVCFIQASTTP